MTDYSALHFEPVENLSTPQRQLVITSYGPTVCLKQIITGGFIQLPAVFPPSLPLPGGTCFERCCGWHPGLGGSREENAQDYMYVCACVCVLQ